MDYIQKTICPYDCPTTCGLLARTDGTRILEIKGDPSHPACQGLICRKMQDYEASIHSPERILTPLRRTGKKGEGKFTPITWEEAVGEITGRWKEILQKEGGDAILPVYFSGVMSLIQRKCGDAFFNRMGACSLVKTLCSTAKTAGYTSVMGGTGCLDPRELSDSSAIFVWGSDVKATRIQTMPILAEARRKGRRVYLIEVCAEDMASYCDEVFLIRPGTDGALALAMMQVLEEEGLSDRAFLESRTEGYEAFKEYLKGCTPEWAQEITGLSADRIRFLARAFGSTEAPAILLGSGPSRYGNGGMNVRLITILSAFTGAWGRPGGGFCGCNPGDAPFIDEALITRPDFRQREGRRVNINLVGQALSEVKSLYVYAGNPAATVCSQGEILAGLEREDLFTVVHERFMTDTARYADIILPAAFSVEQEDCYTAYGYSTFGYAPQVIPPPGECKSNWDTFCLLAEAMGYEEPYFKRTEKEMVQELFDHPGEGLLRLSPEQWEQLRQGGTVEAGFKDHSQFKTKTGKLQIVNKGLKTPLPCWQPPHGGKEPLRLVSVPSCYTLNSNFLDREELAGRNGEQSLLLNLEDAAERGINEGDRILAFNDLAQVPFTARLSSLISRGSAAAVGVYTRVNGGLLVNALHHPRLSDLGEATTMNDNTIEVSKYRPEEDVR